MLTAETRERQARAIKHLLDALLMERFFGSITLKFSDGGIQPRIEKSTSIQIKL